MFLQVLFVKTEAKIVEILRCLEKTEPPVLVFAERKSDVDAIQEYLLLKGVQAVSTHGKFFDNFFREIDLVYFKKIGK